MNRGALAPIRGRNRRPIMLAIATIFAFIAVVAAFNYFEFGRVD
ncbi:hypothetical protein ABC365_15285 [Brevundimonas sp. 3P9-tot-E]|nr:MULTISPECIES: hypothetical protein [Brevundimonas]EGF95625.1 putative membrane protein [Brevundimonas diminuta ATCC 11568]MDA1321588.1 hypothetical protein [Pseudomonadota bacterium]MCZ4107996.1 hypothetical protein [Brevundimonas diminuta]MDM8353683.1 hypothetical protein [Brevundimonas diminuta]HRL25848.1 hypothetical protein [Brevundimonas diminuta]